MTVQNLYTQYLDGKITQSKFLYEVRRDQNLDMISSSNSFDDVVKILKNKSIISEKAHKEAKQATGKQEVEIIAKTIDMVNPYEYTRGMNYELEILDIPASSGDLSDGNILKAQKKVLANLTKNPQFYFDKLNGKKEVGAEWIEVTKKEIEKIGKGKAAKGVIREGVEANKLSNTFSNEEILRAIAPYGKIKEFIPYMQSLRKSGDEFENIDDYVEDFRNYVADKSLEEHGQYADRVADVNADSSPLKEKQEAIYKKYAESTGIPMENLMSMVKEAKNKKMEEAIALKDKAGNVQYAKDSTEASNIERAAKTKGVTLTKSQA